MATDPSLGRRIAREDTDGSWKVLSVIVGGNLVESELLAKMLSPSQGL